jgi:hypothetical protein
MSFINIIKNRGPRIDPWGTPALIVRHLECALSIKWLVNFNPQKTETMTITRKINKPLHPPLIMNNTIINQVTEHKHLGLDISNDGSWQKHIDFCDFPVLPVTSPNPSLYINY